MPEHGDAHHDTQRVLPMRPDELTPDEDAIDLLDYVEVLVRRRWMIFWGTLICVAVSYLYTLSLSQQPERYRAEAVVLTSEQRDVSLDARAAESARGSYLNLLSTPALMRSVLERSVVRGAEGRRDTVRLRDYFGGPNIKHSLDALGACSRFSQEIPGFITITVTLNDREVAVGVANAFADELERFGTDRQQKLAQENLEFLRVRMERAQEELEAAEEKVLEFQRENRSLLGGVGYQDPEISLQFSRIQRRVGIWSSLYSTLLNQYETGRFQLRLESPTFEVHRARLEDVVPISSADKGKPRVLIGFLVGLLVMGVLAFVLEYVDKARKSGRLEPIYSELTGDWQRLRRLLKR